MTIEKSNASKKTSVEDDIDRIALERKSIIPIDMYIDDLCFKQMKQPMAELIVEAEKSKSNMHNNSDIEHNYKHIITPKNNAFGLIFSIDEHGNLQIYLRPLNDVFPKIEDIGKVFCGLDFSREFIEEDDIEYALDILNLFNVNEDKCIHINASKADEILHVLDLLKTEYVNGDDASYILMKSLLKVLFLYLIRIHKQQFLAKDVSQERVYQFITLLEENYKEHISGVYYANAIGVSEKRLNQILKDKLGLTAKQIVRQRQITEIKRMLEKQEMTIKEIAFTFHFDVLSSFSRFFKHHTGRTPIEYRNNYRF